MNNSIFDLVIAPWKTAVLHTAIRLKIFTVLSNRQISANELAAQTNTNEVSLQAVLNALVCMGLLRFEKDKYQNSHLSRIYFVEDEPFYVGDFIQLLANESSKWSKLFSIVSKEKEISCDSDESHRTFIKAMHNVGMLGEVDALINRVNLSTCPNMVDAGGGSGIYSIALCQKYPELKSTILDSHETLAVTKEFVSKHDVRERIELRECDITKDKLGDNIDAVLLSDVIYDVAEAEKILQNVWNCLRAKGQLIIRGYYYDAQNSNPLFGALFMINQLVLNSEREIVTLSSLKALIEKTGYIITTVSPLTERSFIIIATKPACS
jgi:ubiquinone/menaquinone biosynthesis C-methylase UbiE